MAAIEPRLLEARIDTHGQRATKSPSADLHRATVLILAGGSGTRLWPLSTRSRPKQFASLVEPGKTMLQLTWDRIPSYVPPARVFVNVARGFEAVALAQLPELDPANLIVAPEERSTLPIAGYATARIEQRVPDATVLLMSSDSFVGDIECFHDALHDCLLAAQTGPHMVALGVVPTRASTQYGYMAVGARAPFGKSVHYGAGYLEKPPPDVAQRLFESGCHDWNTGAFAWDSKVFFAACRAHAPDHHDVFDRMRGREGIDEAELAALFAQLPAQDLDRGVMERLEVDARGPRLLVVRGRFDWDDVGSFAALHERLSHDAAGNAVAGNVQARDTRRCTLVCEAPMKLHVDGLSDALVAATTQGDIAVCARDHLSLLPRLADQPLFCGLSLDDGRLAPTVHHGGNLVQGFARLAQARNIVVRSDARTAVSVVGVNDCSVEVSGRRVRVTRRARVPALSACREPDWLTIDDDHEAMSVRAALSLVDDLRELLAERAHPVVVLSAGKTPVRIYELLCTRYRDAIAWSRIVLFQMDEYVAPAGDGRAFRPFLETSLVRPLGLRAHLLAGDASLAALTAHEASIDAAGGIDLVLHGIGSNGHLGFNEPGSSFASPARRVTLAPSSRPSGAPTMPVLLEAVTLGLRQLTSARRVRLIASGATKREAVRQALLGPRTPACPASSLQRHPDLKVFIDRDACGWIGQANE